MGEKLPIFKGYSVDVRLRQFRKVTIQKIEFVCFNSIRGEKLLNQYIKSLDPESEEFKQLIKYF